MPSDIDLMLGGANSAQQALAPYEARRQKGLDDAQPLSPYERALGLVLSGKFSPREVAIRIRKGLPLEDVPEAPSGMSQPGGGFSGGLQMPDASAQPVAGGTQAPPPAQTYPQVANSPQAPQGGPSYGYTPGQGQGYAPQAPAPQAPSAPMPTQGAALQAGNEAYPLGQYGQGPQQSLAPQTRGDMNALQSAAPFLQRDQSSEMKQLLEMMKEQGRNGRNAENNNTRVRGQNVRGSIAANQLTESARQADDRIQLGYDALQNRLDGISMMVRGAAERQSLGKKENLELAAIKLKHSELLRLQSNMASMLNGIGNIAENPRVVAEIGGLRAIIEQKATELENDIQQLQSVGTTRSGSAPLPRGEMTPEGIQEPKEGAVGIPKTNVKAAPDGGYSRLKGGGVTTSAGATNGNPAEKVKVRRKSDGSVGMLPANSPKIGTEYERIP